MRTTRPPQRLFNVLDAVPLSPPTLASVATVARMYTSVTSAGDLSYRPGQACSVFSSVAVSGWARSLSGALWFRGLWKYTVSGGKKWGGGRGGGGRRRQRWQQRRQRWRQKSGVRSPVCTLSPDGCYPFSNSCHSQGREWTQPLLLLTLILCSH